MKKFLQKIEEIKNMKNGKAILFFAFYLVFFIVIFLSIKFGSRRVPSGADYEELFKRNKFVASDILNNNYNFNYVITLDGVEYNYSGQRYEKNELFKFNNKDYYYNGDSYFVKDNIWVKNDNPYIFNEFLDIKNITQMIDFAMFESNTSFSDGNQEFNYLISSNTINKEIKGIDSDFLEEPNKIKVLVDGNNVVNGFKFSLDSYCQANKLCNKSLEINLKYDGFREVQKIENPIE